MHATASLWTIGHSNRSIDELIAMLAEVGVTLQKVVTVTKRGAGPLKSQ